MDPEDDVQARVTPGTARPRGSGTGPTVMGTPTPEQLEKLAEYDGAVPVLSSYLDLDRARRLERSFRAVFEDLFNELGDRLDRQKRLEAARDAARIQAWLEDASPAGKGLAIFSCSDRDLWQAHVLAVRVRNHIAFEPMPDLAPLIEILDEYERYAVALVDLERARLFVVFAGEIEERVAFRDEVPGERNQDREAQRGIQRLRETLGHWHLRRVAQRLSELLRRRSFDRLILAGPEEATMELRQLLPRTLASRVVAVMPADITAREDEILTRTQEVERAFERHLEERVVETLLDTAAAGGRAVVGLEATLDALWPGAVDTLVIADDFHAPGGECSNCWRLHARSSGICDACGGSIRPLHDVTHRAMADTVEDDGRVEIVHDAAARLLELRGGIGARLRFLPPGPA